MSEKVRAFAPATVANFVCGYDILGFAIDGIGDEVEVSFNGKEECEFTLHSDIPELQNIANEKNVSYAMVQLLLEKTGRHEGIHIHLWKNMPLNSGMGSSSASSVAALVAANQLLGSPLSKNELLPLAMEGERLACGNAHADNVAPCLLGGIVLVKSTNPLEVVSLPVPEDWYVAVLHPHVDVPTRLSRKILKEHILMKDAVVQFGNIAGLLAGIYEQNDELTARSMTDILVEPHRALLIPSFYEMKNVALHCGAIGFGISGSGPSVFALCRGKRMAEKVQQELKGVMEDKKLNFDSWVSGISVEGARCL